MRCCVQNCFNDDSKKTNKSQGITFHKLPKHPDQSAAWLTAIERLGCRMNKCLVVCSEHFLPEDFDDTRPNQRRVKTGAVPTIMAPAVIQEELKVCRVCLAFDVKMYDMKDFRLSEMFQNITGISVIDKNDSILQRVCWECAARLTAAAAFRDKALLSDALLKVHAHNNITECDIATLKQNYSSLKSPLTVQAVFTSSDIECEGNIYGNEEIDNIFLQNNEMVIKERKAPIKNNKKEIELEEYEPWIDVPVKTEVESDPIADNNMRFQDRRGDTFLVELTHFNDTSPRDDAEGEMTNTEVQIKNNGRILREDNQNEVPIINDVNIVIEEDNDNIEKKPKLDIIGNIIDEPSSEEDTQRSAEEVSVNKSKQSMSSEVVTMKETGSIRNNESLKEKIIALNKRGFSVAVIAKEIGMSTTSVYTLLKRYNLKVTKYRKSATLGREQTVNESCSEQNYCNNNTEAGKQMGACSTTVKRRMRQAGLEHILMIKPERTVDMGQKISKHKLLHDDLKQRIIALKQEGMSNSRIAYLLQTTRVTVGKWWRRWCNDGNMTNHKNTRKRQRKTTAQEDQLLIDRVTQEQTVHTPSLAKELGISVKSVRSRLREAGFTLKGRKASVPLRSGRSHKVDEFTKQQIVLMKHNGVSVTDIANQFRVTRTSVYLWWRRWCKENNIKMTSDNNTSTATEQEQSSAEDTNVEKSLQPPTIISSQKSLWQKLPDVEFISY